MARTVQVLITDIVVGLHWILVVLSCMTPLLLDSRFLHWQAFSNLRFALNGVRNWNLRLGASLRFWTSESTSSPVVNISHPIRLRDLNQTA